MKILVLLLSFLLLIENANANNKMIFATNWVAQPEHGGFYQALVDDEYSKCGLNVEIIQGGPNSNNRAKLITKKIDLYMGGNLIQLINARSENIPIKMVASFFQKDPQIIISHPDGNLKNWESIKDADPIFISDLGLVTFYKWMEKEYGFKSSKRRPYFFNPSPFLANVNSAQQGYLTSEPYVIKRELGIEPNIFLLAEHGFDTYATTIEVLDETITNREEDIQCFIDASKIGWRNYLYGDSSKANELIKKENPDMTDEKINYSISKLKQYGIVDSGDTLKNGIGYFSPKRIQAFYKKMLEYDVVKELDNIDDIFTQKFIKN
ncbi:MAG: ABC transporter substrate-binding protein [Hyphomicrobiales bacterium]